MEPSGGVNPPRKNIHPLGRYPTPRHNPKTLAAVHIRIEWVTYVKKFHRSSAQPQDRIALHRADTTLQVSLTRSRPLAMTG